VLYVLSAKKESQQDKDRALDRTRMSGKLTGAVVVVVKVLQSARGEWVPTAEISGPALPRQKERRGW
jgi:hypothetical protein